MRIVIDMQGAQTESRFRGIGRYTMAFAQAVVRNKGEHEIILALSGLFPHTIEPIRAAFDGLLPQENILVWHAPGPVRDISVENTRRREVAELIREAFFASLCPDIIHVCSLFEDDSLSSIGRFDDHTPVTVTLYDLIPALNPDEFLCEPNYRAHYERKLNTLKRAKLLLAISEHTKQEGLNYLEVDAKHIVNVSTAIGPEFKPIKVDVIAKEKLLRKIEIVKPFVLWVGTSDPHKNLPRLIEAWSKLPIEVRKSHQLLLVGKINKEEIRCVARRQGLRDTELLFSGYLSDDELIQLYNLCKLFVLPSLHEGFGLPALEAMACGAPVIGSNTTSLPEVIGLAEALFDPFNVEAIRDKLEKALGDDIFRNRLKSHVLAQSQKFSWNQSGIWAIEAWEREFSIKKNDIEWPHINSQYSTIYIKLIQAISRLDVSHDELCLKKVATCLAENEKQTFDFHRRKELPKKITWRIEGPFDSSYSLALVNREIAKALTELGHHVILHSTEGAGDYQPKYDFLKNNPDLDQMYQLASAVTQWKTDISSRNLYPPRVADMTSRLNALHGYGWEETGFPLEWAENFNLYLQGMTLMSNHVKKVMIDHGVSIPMSVSYIGVDHWERIMPDPEFRVQAKAFRFLHVSSCFPRKGADIMLRAYGRSFRKTDNVTLVIKTFANPHNEIHRWLDEAKSSDASFPDVQIIESDLTDAQLKSLYLQCHSLLAPSRAEGFGLPMAEAMLSGLPVITTGWSGQTDFCKSNTSWLIDYSFKPAKSHFGIFSSVWAEPNEIHLAQLMREVYQCSDQEKRSRTDAGRDLLLKHFRWTHTAQRMVDAAREWSSFTHKKNPKIGWVSTWNSKCGIAKYSEHLVKNMPTTITVFANYSNSVIAEDSNQVRRCWHQGKSDDLEDLSKEIDEQKIDVLVIQFNYSFFNFESFKKFLVKQKKLYRKIIITMHSTTDPDHAHQKKLSELASCFSDCDRILVHRPKDLNQLKNIDLIDNVSLFPHGILDYKITNKPERNQDEDFIVASYGFFLPHKGLLELIEAVGLLHINRFKIRLEMINAEYPLPVSRDLIKDAHQLVERLGLKKIVNLSTDFLKDSDSLTMLAKADLIVFPYQNTTESSSAAVRHGLASHRTVACTPLSIFDDVSEVVHLLPGNKPEQIAQGLLHLLTKPSLLEAKSAAQEKWLHAHAWSEIGRRFQGMIEGLVKAS